ncbi:MAG: hypothetical protein IH597_16115 [Bacteroidales bacterium]|nr:hypothetical protein [Bacteroidales bacterium]
MERVAYQDKIYIEITERQLPTKAICNKGFSGNSNILPRIKFGVTWQESRPQSPTISYRQPLQASLKDDTATINRTT